MLLLAKRLNPCGYKIQYGGSFSRIDQQTILGISILFNVYLSLIGNKYTLYFTIKHTFYSLKFQTLVDCQKSLDKNSADPDQTASEEAV